MKKFFLVICILTLSSSLTFAQSGRKSGLLLSGGFSTPAAPEKFYNNWQVGIDLGGGLEFALSRSIALVLYFDYDQFPVNEEQFLENTGSRGIAGASVSAISFSGNLKAYLNADPEALSYYLIFGAGHSKFVISEAIVASDEFFDTFESASESAFLAAFGLGFDVPAGSATNFFVEGKYCIVFTELESKQYVPIRVGVKINF
jgi:opacity protein-like surface antigen